MLLIARDLLASSADSMAGRWAVETHALSVDDHAKLSEATGGVDLLPAGRLVERLREVKDADEIAATRTRLRDQRRGVGGSADPTVRRQDRAPGGP